MKDFLFCTAGAACGTLQGVWLIVMSRDHGQPASTSQVMTETVPRSSPPCYRKIQTAGGPRGFGFG